MFVDVSANLEKLPPISPSILLLAYMQWWEVPIHYKHRQFLLSFQRGAPEWSLLGVPHARRLPAVRWRMRKLAHLKERERADLFAGLEMALVASSSGGTRARSTDLTG